MKEHGELAAALAAHDKRAKVQWTGPFHFREENERIARARQAAFARLGYAADDEPVMGNAALLEALRAL